MADSEPSAGTERSADSSDGSSGSAGDGSDHGGDRGAEDVRDDSDATATAADDGPDSLAAALRVRRNARVGIAAGFAFTLVLTLPRLPAAGSGFFDSPGLLGLAVVLGVTSGAVITAGLCAAVMLQPVLDGPAWLYRGGSAAAAGGLGWLGLPLAARLADGGLLGTDALGWLVALSTLAVLVGAAGVAADLRNAAGIGTRSAAWVLAFALLLAAGNGLAGPSLYDGAGPDVLPTALFANLALSLVAALPLAVVSARRDDGPSIALAFPIGIAAAGLGAGWLLLGGWSVLAAAVATPGPAALALVTAPAGAGWLAAGVALRIRASRLRTTGATGSPSGEAPAE